MQWNASRVQQRGQGERRRLQLSLRSRYPRTGPTIGGREEPTEGRRGAVVKGISRFDAAEGVVGLPRERGDAAVRGGVFVRGPVATVNARRAGRLLETSTSLLSIDERFNSATARLEFRSPRFPPSCLLPHLRSM
eukprot:6211849-Pleurochrysis_carterae.AAC.11